MAIKFFKKFEFNPIINRNYVGETDFIIRCMIIVNFECYLTTFIDV